MSKGKVKVTDMGMRERVKQLHALTRQRVEVGIHETAGAAADGLTLATIGAIQEYGTEDIPARPWLTQGIAAAKPAELMRREAKAVANGERTARVAAERLGLAVVAAVQERIAEGIAPPNAPATQAAKGSSTPLIDTGRLRQSISHVVSEEEG